MTKRHKLAAGASRGRGSAKHARCIPSGPDSTADTAGMFPARWRLRIPEGWRQMISRLAKRLLPWKRPPDFVIGSPDHPYLLRWWVIPRNRWFNIYLHQIRRDDDDRALHDHPWTNISILLRGAYDEITAQGTVTRRAPCVVFRRATDAHRLKLPVENGGIRYCWSLFITGPRVREWYFHCPRGLVHWQDFVSRDNPGGIGKGCDQ